MELLGKLFGSKQLKRTDPYFGDIESFSTKENNVDWQVNHKFLDANIKLRFTGNKEDLSKIKK
ncbi:hypothetical protein [Psychroserpens sp.]|jgi:hypothetical protein|uniref:hypothetical protein n=1 Tax=Psychroserpens sp. TaxID=2020870 RepID=UPI0039E564D0